MTVTCSSRVSLAGILSSVLILIRRLISVLVSVAVAMLAGLIVLCYNVICYS